MANLAGSPVGAADFLLTEGVQARYGVSRRTVYQWIKDGTIPYTRIPGTRRILFNVAELREWEQTWGS